MINYTLLPKHYIRKLKTQYRMHILVTLLFFIALALALGILSLSPSYILSYSQEKELVGKVEKIQKNREAEGIDTLLKELGDSQAFVRQLQTDAPKVFFVSNLEKILSLRTRNITLTSFDVASSSETVSDFVIQGKALTRESLLVFKKSLESDPSLTKVELPISDLAKSKDISFTLRFSIQNSHEK